MCGLSRALRLALSRWYLIGTLTGLRRPVGMVAGVGVRGGAGGMSACILWPQVGGDQRLHGFDLSNSLVSLDGESRWQEGRDSSPLL